jgi:hypothetical protein
MSKATSRATARLAIQRPLLTRGNTNRDETLSYLIYMSKMYYKCVYISRCCVVMFFTVGVWWGDLGCRQDN